MAYTYIYIIIIREINIFFPKKIFSFYFHFFPIDLLSYLITDLPAPASKESFLISWP